MDQNQSGHTFQNQLIENMNPFGHASFSLLYKANCSMAVFTCMDILNQRAEYWAQRSNPVRKMSTAIVANARDETLED